MFFNNIKSVAFLDENYLDLCKKAVSEDKVFDNFRNLRDYKNILEHVDKNLALKYLENIKTISDLTNREIFNICDKLSYIGNPELINLLGDQKPISTSSLRYLNVALQLINEFGDKNINNIVEIGPGYGGQSIILEEFFTIKEYTYIDLPEVNSLIDIFVKKSKVEFSYNLKTLEDEFEGTRYDLIISNYAFSELNSFLQIKAIKNIINKSNNCFMIINSNSFENHKKYKKLKFLDQETLLQKIKNSYIKDEIPNTANGNYLLLAKEN